MKMEELSMKLSFMSDLCCNCYCNSLALVKMLWLGGILNLDVFGSFSSWLLNVFLHSN